jgi:2-methylisocitrate lyase-like PEP mutase family enzyme
VSASAAERLRAMHHGPRPLVLPNAWDPVSARAYADAGFAALATSSAAVAATLGYADGQTPGAEMLTACGRIARAVDVPVTADFENGYGLAPAELAARLAEAGLAGCNLEDSDPVSHVLADPARQADYLAAVRAAAGPGLVINARVDVFIRPAAPARATAGSAGSAGRRDPAQAVALAIERAAAYLRAGADCVYPIIAPPAALPELVRGIDGPVNVMQWPGGPSLAELAAIGVARITFGGGLHKRADAAVRKLARTLAAEAAEAAGAGQDQRSGSVSTP